MGTKKRIENLERETGEDEPTVVVVRYDGQKPPRRPTQEEIDREWASYEIHPPFLVWDNGKFTNRKDE